jgi:hypothetical protein
MLPPATNFTRRRDLACERMHGHPSLRKHKRVAVPAIVWRILLCPVDSFLLCSEVRGAAPIDSLEISAKVTSISKADLPCDLLHAQERCTELFTCFFHPQKANVMLWRDGCLGLKQVGETPRGEVDASGEFTHWQETLTR